MTNPPPPPSPYVPEPVPAPAAATAKAPAAPAATNAAAPAATPAPVAPLTTDAVSVWLAASIAALLLVSAVVNAVSGVNFPSNAPIEQIWDFGITVDLVAGVITLGVRFLVIFRRPRAAAPGRSVPGGFAIAGTILGALTVVGWLILGGGDFLGKLLGSGDYLRYYLDVNGTFFMGIPWILGIVFGVVAYRQGRGTANTVLSLVAIALGVLVLIPTLYSAVVYGLGMSA